MPDPLDIFQLAAENVAHVEQLFGAILADDLSAAEREAIEQFAQTVQEEARISINMLSFGLRRFLELGMLRNLYGRAQARVDDEGMSMDDALKQESKDFCERRMLFDSHFQESRTFDYGAVNMGGCGCHEFGPFCAVLRQEFPADTTRVVCVMHNTLIGYTADGPSFDLEKMRQEIAPHSHRGRLAAVKHRTAVCGNDGQEWATVLCCKDNCIEAIFVEQPRREHLECVRVTSRELRRLKELEDDDLFEELPVGLRAGVDDFQTIRKDLADQGVGIEEVADA